MKKPPIKEMKVRLSELTKVSNENKSKGIFQVFFLIHAYFYFIFCAESFYQTLTFPPKT